MGWDSVLLFHSLHSLLRLLDIPNPQTKVPIPKITSTKMVKVNIPEASRSPMDGASYEHEGLMHLLAAAGVQRQPHVDDEPSSKATMWDPVKDCSDTNTTQADLSGLLPDGHSSEQLTHSTARNLTSMDLDSRYDQSQGARQQSTNAGFREAASMGPPPYPRSLTMVSGYQDRASMGSQIWQMTPSYDQSRPRPQQQSGYENGSALNQHARGSLGQNGQRSLESIARGAAPLGIQPRLPNYLRLHSQENGQPMDMESRMPASMVSTEAARPQRSSPCRRTQVPTAALAKGSNPSTHSKPDQVGIATGHGTQQGNGSQHQSLLATTAMSQALSMGRYGESLDQQSNYTEATHVYERACVLLQEVILRSGSIEERMECNIAVSQ